MMRNICEVLERAVKKGPEKPFLWFEGKSLTYHNIYREASRVAHGFRELGLKKGDRVALMLPNIPEFLAIWFGSNSLGASIVPVNTYFKGEEISYVLNHSGSKMAVIHGDYYSMVQPLLPNCPQIAQSIVVQTKSELENGAIPYENLIDHPSGQMPEVVVDEEDEAAILYTSGTTGHPKGCVLQHSYYLLAGERFSKHLKLGEKDCILTPLPLFHMNPQILSTMATLWVGARLALLDRFHPKSWWDSVRESGATIFHYQGVMPAMLMGLEPSGRDAGHPHWIGMGAGVPQRLHREFEQRFNVTLLEGFGMTESGLNFLAHVEEERKVGTGCFGKVFPEYEAKVFGDNDQEVEPGEVGELVLRGSDSLNREKGFMKEYYQNPQATEEVWRNGWFHTGDYVKRDAEGYFYFVDRKKDIIRRSGENISALEVEDTIRSHPSVLDVAVVAVPDAIREQEIKAYLIPIEGQKLQIHDLIDWCEQRLAYFKIPRYWEFRDQFPLTKTGKVQKQKLRTESSDLRANSYDRVDQIFRTQAKKKGAF